MMLLTISESTLNELIQGGTAVAVALLGIVGGIIGGIHLKRQKARDEKVTATLTKVDNQVSNDHDSNLRHDIDAVGRAATEAKEISQEMLRTVQLIHGTVNNMEARVVTNDQRTAKLAGMVSEHLDWAADKGARIEKLENLLEQTQQVGRNSDGT